MYGGVEQSPMHTHPSSELSLMCEVPCVAGFACPPGSTNATAVLCSAGQYSVAGSGVCTNCSAGIYGSVSGQPSAACSGLCLEGRFGSTSGLTSMMCEGPCVAGYACPPGSTNATAVLCSAGQYSVAASGSCTLCDKGRFGASSGLGTNNCSGLCVGGSYGARTGETQPTCTGPCRPGYACPPGSMVDTAVVCPAGTFSTGAADQCTLCAAGKYSSNTSRPLPCDVDCPPGSFCVEGSSAPVLCPGGRYGSSPALPTSACTAACPVGSYCVAGAVTPVLCSPGA